MGYAEDEIWDMTIGKFNALYTEYLKDRGIKLEKEQTIDDALPF
jgi:hypothetical protein